ADHFDFAARFADVAQSLGHGNGARLGDAEDAIDIIAKTVEQVLRSLIGEFDGDAGVLVGRNDFEARELRQSVEESFFAFFGARRSDGVTEQNDIAGAVEKFGHVLGGELAPFKVVGGDIADLFVRLEPGVNNNDWNAGVHGAGDGIDKGLFVERGKHDPANVAAGEVFDYLDLLVAVVLAERAFPDHFHGRPLGGKFLFSFGRAGVDRFPIFVGGAFGNDRDGVAVWRGRAC